MTKIINRKSKSISNDNQRIISLDILRIIACYLVCYCHIVSESQYIYNNSFDGDWFFITTTFIVSKIAVPIFFMISGALMLREEQDVKKMLKKTFIRIIIPLFVFSALIYFKDNLYFNITNILNFFKHFINGTIIMPYWYLYSLIGIYIMTPFISTLVNKLNDRKYKHLMIIGFFFTIVLNTLKNLNIGITPITNISLTTYFYYFILGHYIFHKCKLGKNKIVILNIISAILLILSTIIITNGNLKECINKIGDVNLLVVFILSIAFILNVKYFADAKELTIFAEKTVRFISQLTFGIYLIHIKLLGILSFSLDFLILHLNDSLAMLIYSGGFFVIMIGIVYIMKKTPIIKKII